MSTTDPATRRHRDVAGQRGNRTQLWLGMLGLTLVALGAAALGVGASLLVEDLRHGVIDDVFDDRTVRMESHPGALPALTFGGIGCLLFGVWTYRRAIHRFRGGELPWPLPGAVGLLAFSVGFIALVPSWLAPLDVGRSIDPVFDESTPWGTGSWILYRAPIWLPVLLVAASLLAAWCSWHAHRTRSALATERDRLLATGRRVPGTVRDVAVRTSSNDVGGRTVVGALVTVAFSDASGTVRSLERFLPGTAAEVARIRDADVLYDPLRPEASTSTFVALRRPALPGDWIGPSAKERRRAR